MATKQGEGYGLYLLVQQAVFTCIAERRSATRRPVQAAWQKRLAGRFFQTGTATGRLSMNELNFQCMPRPRDFRVPLTQAPANSQLSGHRNHTANIR